MKTTKEDLRITKRRTEHDLVPVYEIHAHNVDDVQSWASSHPDRPYATFTTRHVESTGDGVLKVRTLNIRLNVEELLELVSDLASAVTFIGQGWTEAKIEKAIADAIKSGDLAPDEDGIKIELTNQLLAQLENPGVLGPRRWAPDDPYAIYWLERIRERIAEEKLQREEKADDEHGQVAD